MLQVIEGLFLASYVFWCGVDQMFLVPLLLFERQHALGGELSDRDGYFLPNSEYFHTQLVTFFLENNCVSHLKNPLIYAFNLVLKFFLIVRFIKHAVHS